MINVDGSVFIQIANFIFLIWIMNMILYKPIRKALLQRKEKVLGLERSIADFSTQALEKENAFASGIKEARANGLKEKQALIQSGSDEEKIVIENSKLPFLPVKKEAVVEWIPYFSSNVKATDPTTYLVTLIIPVKNREEAFRIGKSISVMQQKDEIYRVSFKNQNTNFSVRFRKTPDGLVLD